MTTDGRTGGGATGMTCVCVRGRQMKHADVDACSENRDDMRAVVRDHGGYRMAKDTVNMAISLFAG